MMSAILDHVADRFRVAPDALAFTVRSGTRGVDGGIVVLIYADREPLVVCRVPRREASWVEVEYGHLKRVNDLVGGNPRLQRSVESPLFTSEIAGRTLFFHEFMPGRVASRALRRWNEVESVAAFLRESTSWLVEFYRATSNHREYDAEAKRSSLETLTRNPYTDHADAFVEDDSLFLAPMHGDFAPQNVIVSDDWAVVGVIDWECFDPSGVPLHDLVDVVWQTTSERQDDRRQRIDATFSESGALWPVVDECVSTFCTELGIRREGFLRSIPLYADIKVGYAHRWGIAGQTFYEWLGRELAERIDAIA